MTINIKNYVIQELEAYPRILRQISVLRYEMEHPAHVSAQEMLDAMAYACGDRTGSSPGHVSDMRIDEERIATSCNANNRV